jgi:hypothetical protein
MQYIVLYFMMRLLLLAISDFFVVRKKNLRLFKSSLKLHGIEGKAAVYDTFRIIQ